jgi:hypothetical protein
MSFSVLYLRDCVRTIRELRRSTFQNINESRQPSQTEPFAKPKKQFAGTDVESIESKTEETVPMIINGVRHTSAKHSVTQKQRWVKEVATNNNRLYALGLS